MSIISIIFGWNHRAQCNAMQRFSVSSVTWYYSFIINSQCKCINLFVVFLCSSHKNPPRSLFACLLSLSWLLSSVSEPLLTIAQFHSEVLVPVHFALNTTCSHKILFYFVAFHSIINKQYLLCIHFVGPCDVLICSFYPCSNPQQWKLCFEFVAHHKTQVMTKQIPPDWYMRTKSKRLIMLILPVSILCIQILFFPCFMFFHSFIFSVCFRFISFSLKSIRYRGAARTHYHYNHNRIHY